MATPHIEAEIGEIADIVLMPGDPARAKLIADTYLEDTIQFNEVRNMYGYTGYYDGKRVSIMGSGMGIPSMGIYSYELFKFYNVQKIIRIGSCGAYSKDINMYDLILAENAYSDSTYAYVQNGSTEKLIEASKDLTLRIEETAKEKGINIIKGNIYTTDVFSFYKHSKEDLDNLKSYNCIASEMEAFALFHNAKIFKKEAACITTVVDVLETREQITAEDRENSLTKMIELVLKSI